ncbi:MAG: hypothetical protein WDO73_35020 [Ignavibacteriota bacterium]
MAPTANAAAWSVWGDILIRPNLEFACRISVVKGFAANSPAPTANAVARSVLPAFASTLPGGAPQTLLRLQISVVRRPAGSCAFLCNAGIVWFHNETPPRSTGTP